MAKKPPMSAVSPITLTRTFNCRIEKVFSYWNDSERFKKWWRPAGFKMVNAHVEARPGGEYSFELQMPDGTLCMQYGRFQELTPPTKLVFTNKCEARDCCEQETLVTAEFRQQGTLTELSVRHELMPNQACRDQAVKNWESVMQALAQALVRAPNTT